MQRFCEVGTVWLPSDVQFNFGIALVNLGAFPQGVGINLQQGRICGIADFKPILQRVGRVFRNAVPYLKM
jgi:hypothetical protein